MLQGSSSLFLPVQLGIGLIFLAAVTPKVLKPRLFAQGISEYGIVPRRVAYGVAFALIPLELVVAVAHLTGWLMSLAVPVTLGMLAVFLFAVLSNLLRGRAIPCHCFGGHAREVISERTVVRLLFLIAGELMLIERSVLVANSAYHYGVGSWVSRGLAFGWAILLLLIGIWLVNSPVVITVLRFSAQSWATRFTGGGPVG
jgi:hypothetical protein